LTDATHILLEKVKYRLRQSHSGFKSSHSSRTYNITVNHCHQILATTTGHPVRWNDKALVLFDNFVVSLNEGNHLDDVSFGLYESDCDGRIETVKYRGAWFIVDDGYLNWPVTVPPLKASTSRHKYAFHNGLNPCKRMLNVQLGF
jgi:hypothetical protein